MVSVVVGAAKTLRRVELTPRLLQHEVRLARIAAFAMAAFLLGSCAWVIDGAAGPKNLFHTGAIDVAGLVAMGVAVATGQRASQLARSMARFCGSCDALVGA